MRIFFIDYSFVVLAMYTSIFCFIAAISYLVNCPPGSQGITGLTCTQCATNTFQDQQGQVICKSCPNGQGTESNGAVECTGGNNYHIMQNCGRGKLWLIECYLPIFYPTKFISIICKTLDFWIKFCTCVSRDLRYKDDNLSVPWKQKRKQNLPGPSDQTSLYS